MNATAEPNKKTKSVNMTTQQVPHIPGPAVQNCIDLLRKRKIAEQEAAVIKAVNVVNVDVVNVKKPKQKVSNGFKKTTQSYNTVVGNGLYKLKMKTVGDNGERNVYGFRFQKEETLIACMKVLVIGLDCSISILVGDFSNILEKKNGLEFHVLMSMLKDFLREQAISSIGSSISREDYNGESLTKKCINAFDMLSCPNEWKEKKNYKLCRDLLKTEGISDLNFYFNREYKVDDANHLYF
jgi:hypothetical protein